MSGKADGIGIPALRSLAAAVSQGAERVDGQTVRYRADEIREIIYR